MDSTLAHVVLTRFNLRSPGAESYVLGTPGWLEHRMHLFETYCLPSVAAQTNRSFHWIIYFDPDSPEWMKQRIAQLSATFAIFVPVYRRVVEREDLLDDIKAALPVDPATLLTSNLDNDDALSADFIQRVQIAGRGITGRAAIYLKVGLIKSDGAVYRRTDPRNPFCSVVEPYDGQSVTCWANWHNLLGQSMPVVEVAGTPGWLQVIHGNNVSNRIRGWRVSPEAYRVSFSGYLSDADSPTKQQLLRDRLIGGPSRFIRESTRQAAKTVIMSTVGKEGLDRLKARRSADQSRRSSV